MFKSLSAWIVLQNSLHKSGTVSFSKTKCTKGPCRHTFFFTAKLKKKNTLNMCFFPMFTYGHTKGCITNRWRVTLKTTVRRSVSLVTIQTGKSGERPWKRHMNWLGKQTNQLKFIPHPYGSFLIENILFSRFTFICHVFEQNVLG